MIGHSVFARGNEVIALNLARELTEQGTCYKTKKTDLASLCRSSSWYELRRKDYISRRGPSIRSLLNQYRLIRSPKVVSGWFVRGFDLFPDLTCSLLNSFPNENFPAVRESLLWDQQHLGVSMAIAWYPWLSYGNKDNLIVDKIILRYLQPSHGSPMGAKIILW